METKTIIVNVEVKMVVKTDGDILSQVRDTIEVMNDIILMSEIEAEPYIQGGVTNSVIFDYKED